MQKPSEVVRSRAAVRWSVAAGLLVLAAACSSESPGGPAAATGTPPAVATTSVAPPGTKAPTTTGSTVTTAPPSTAVTLVAGVDPVGNVIHGTLEAGGRHRTYRLYVPRVLPGAPVALFIALHGGTGWGDQFATTNHIERLAESNGFIVVHPDGVKVATSPGGVWNGGVCCGVAARERVDDVAFIAALIDQLMNQYEIDPHRVYAFGHSNGAIMSYRLACELADRIVGVGVVAGALGVDGCHPAQPVSVIQIHGTADKNIPIAGGVGAESIVNVDFPPPHDGFDTLAALDGCPDPQLASAGDLTIESRGPCDAGSAARFVTIETANHAWPGGTPVVTPAVGQGYANYDATAELVTFLLSHPRS